ncbi:MAG: DNA gyrase inhibitor YacG [Candidatus Binatota bacterium]|jgi:endogenous inhibitor of DNA gyrase (YacG/DUF329 family)
MPRTVRCPICRTEVSWEENPHRPFCSERCRLIDLGAWSEGRYRLPGEKVNPESKKENGDDEEESP